MQQPPRITFQGLEPSEFVARRVREKVTQLERVCDQLTGCNVTVEASHHHRHKGNLYAVQLVLSVPGRHFVVGAHPQQDHAHEDVYVALRDAFDAAERQLEDFLRSRRARQRRPRAHA